MKYLEFCDIYTIFGSENVIIMPNETLNPYSIEELNARVAISEIQIANGNVYSHEAVMQALQQKKIQTA